MRSQAAWTGVPGSASRDELKPRKGKSRSNGAGGGDAGPL